MAKWCIQNCNRWSYQIDLLGNWNNNTHESGGDARSLVFPNTIYFLYKVTVCLYNSWWIIFCRWREDSSQIESSLLPVCASRHFSSKLSPWPLSRSRAFIVLHYQSCTVFHGGCTYFVRGFTSSSLNIIPLCKLCDYLLVQFIQMKRISRN